MVSDPNLKCPKCKTPLQWKKKGGFLTRYRVLYCSNCGWEKRPKSSSRLIRWWAGSKW